MLLCIKYFHFSDNEFVPNIVVSYLDFLNIKVFLLLICIIKLKNVYNLMYDASK